MLRYGSGFTKAEVCRLVLSELLRCCLEIVYTLSKNDVKQTGQNTYDNWATCVPVKKEHRLLRILFPCLPLFIDRCTKYEHLAPMTGGLRSYGKIFGDIIHEIGRRHGTRKTSVPRKEGLSGSGGCV